MQWKELNSNDLVRLWFKYAIWGLHNEDRTLREYVTLIKVYVLLYFLVMASLLLNAFLNDGGDLLREALYPVHWGLAFVIGLCSVFLIPYMKLVYIGALTRSSFHVLDTEPIMIQREDFISNLQVQISTVTNSETKTNTVSSTTHYPRHRYQSFEFIIDESTELGILYNADIGIIEKVLFKGSLSEWKQSAELMDVIQSFFIGFR